MKDATVQLVSRLSSIADALSTCSLALSVAIDEIPYDKYKRQVDALYGTVAILDQLAKELKSLSEKADGFTSNAEIWSNEC